ncbi:hypothetical protein Scep_029477 [Stephania cephalantha]|uniref:Uncharacterized protein n=1 Tax=Stephania cephalantha TaxID=152367 RepID=A0AAP0DXT0_9MAGN
MEESIGSVKVVPKGQMSWNDLMDKIMLEIILEEYGFGRGGNISKWVRMRSRYTACYSRCFDMEIISSETSRKIIIS